MLGWALFRALCSIEVSKKPNAGVLVMAGLAQVVKQRATARKGVSFSRKTRTQLESVQWRNLPRPE